MTMEFSLDETLEIERPIQANELPAPILAKYQDLRKKYDTIYLEKVFRFREKNAYELYCYKNGKLTKLNFD